MQVNRLTNVRDDLCAIKQYTQQSVGPGKYATTYLVPDAKTVNPLAVESLIIYPREGYGFNTFRCWLWLSWRNTCSMYVFTWLHSRRC